MSENVLLKMTNIKKSFGGIHALRNGNLEVKKGEIHGFVGENGAGKSTLMKILLGIHTPDEGEILFKGEKIRFKNPAEALNKGISMIHQEISLVPELSIAQNVWLGQEKLYSKGGVINRKAMSKATVDLMHKMQIDLDPDKQVKKLSIAEMQLVEIARAVSYNSDLIIMDEPTSALTNVEIELLFKIAQSLIKEGKSIIFISHKLDEILTICDNVTTMRDGMYIATDVASDLTQEKLIQRIVGRDNVEIYKREPNQLGEPVLEVENLSSKGLFQNISFTLHAGEVLGFAGLMGAGRTEIMRAIFGADKNVTGKVSIHGKPVKFKSPRDAVDHGIGMVQEDRLRAGAIYSMSVLENATISKIRDISKAMVLNTKEEKGLFQKTSEELLLKYGSSGDSIKTLSGGNQQKVIFARWHIMDSKILILDEPTRGIDVGAKSEIYKLIDKLAAQGLAVIVVSSELPELLALSDRIMVVRNGRIVSEHSGAEATQEKIMTHAFGA